jgi:hypothetical protein
MYLVRLVYASKVVNEQFSADDIKQVLESARKNNSKYNLTGLLCFSSKYFLQCLEGPRMNVNQTYQRILADTRHKDILLLDYQEIDRREFANWGMGYVPQSSLTRPLNLKYSGSPEFDPFDMSGESCHQLLLESRGLVPVQ